MLRLTSTETTPFPFLKEPLGFQLCRIRKKEIVVDRDIINTTLQESSEIEEIIIPVFGTKEKEVTGSVSLLSSETIENLKPTRIEQALQGQVAGVNITASSGASSPSASE